MASLVELKEKAKQRAKDFVSGTRRCSTGCGAESSGQPVKMASGKYEYFCLKHKRDSQIKDRKNLLAEKERIEKRAEDELEGRQARAQARQRMEHDAGQITLW